MATRLRSSEPRAPGAGAPVTGAPLTGRPAPGRPVTGRRGPAGPVTGWVGALAVAGVAVWLGVEGGRYLAGAGSLTRALAASRSQMVGPALVAVVVAIFAAERIWPAVRRPPLARAHLVDAGYLLLFAVVVAPLVTLLDTGFALTVERHARFLILDRMPAIPEAGAVLLILVGIDAMNWAAHVANHRSGSLWRFHALHHSQEDMSVLTTFRTHPFAHASYLPALLPALVLGASGTVPAAALVTYSCLVTLPHANLPWTLGPLGRVVVSPAYHRLHHAQTSVLGRQAVNFGFVLVGWDRLARCAVYPEGGAPIPTGIAGRPVPVEQLGPTARVPAVVLRQIVDPFVLKTTKAGTP